jgi:hypothetical protein
MHTKSPNYSFRPCFSPGAGSFPRYVCKVFRSFSGETGGLNPRCVDKADRDRSTSKKRAKTEIHATTQQGESRAFLIKRAATSLEQLRAAKRFVRLNQASPLCALSGARDSCVARHPNAHRVWLCRGCHHHGTQWARG